MKRCGVTLATDAAAAAAASSSGQQLAAAPVPQASPVYLRLFVQLQLLAATLHQQQQQQGVTLVNNQGSIWLELLRHQNILLRKYIRAVTQLKLPQDVQGIQQLLAGPYASLLRALAVPLHVAEVWAVVDDQRLSDQVGSPGEQLFALKACLDTAAGSTESGEQEGFVRLGQVKL
jgi:hypothetical protein